MQGRVVAQAGGGVAGGQGQVGGVVAGRGVVAGAVGGGAGAGGGGGVARAVGPRPGACLGGGGGVAGGQPRVRRGHLRLVLRGLVWLGVRGEGRRLVAAGGHRPGVVAVVVGEGEGLGAVDLEMLPEAAGVGVALVAAPHPAVVRLVRGVDMHVLLTITGVGEPSVTTLNLALERFLACKLKEYLEPERCIKIFKT